MAAAASARIGRIPHSIPHFPRPTHTRGPYHGDDMAVNDLSLGAEELAAGRWSAARARFEAAMAVEESLDALDGLGQALWWLGEVGRAIELRERAYAELRRRGDARAAARLALWLSTEYAGHYGNTAAANGWLARAQRLVETLPRCPEQGWVIFRKGKRRTDAAATEEDARAVIAIARETGDRDLEVAGINLLGRALLGLGRADEGFAHIDESMAAALGGEVGSLAVVAETCCSTIVACERTLELARATQWCQVTDDFARRHGYLPVLAFCRITYATVLIATGRWAEAEPELLAALESYRRTFPAMCAHALNRLALLRLLQGRLVEAEELLKGNVDNPVAAQAAATLLLCNGAPGPAARLAKRRLDAVGSDALLAPPFLFILVEAALARKDATAAREAAQRLLTIATPTGCAGLIGLAKLANGMAATFTDEARAIAWLEDALETFDRLGMPFESARSRLHIAGLLSARDGDIDVALSEAQGAKAAFEQLGARRFADEAAELLRKLGVGSRGGSTGARIGESLSRRELEVVELLGRGLSNTEIGARLFISPKTVEHHVGHVLAKLNVKNRAAVAAYAARSGLASGPSRAAK
jgi:DNA-binding CsgD family transcriptional regulator